MWLAEYLSTSVITVARLQGVVCRVSTSVIAVGVCQVARCD